MAAIVNFHQNFSVVKHPTGSLLHREPGRSVHHNLHRLPSPAPTHDFRTSILLGGNHPQNQFRNFSSRAGSKPMTTGGMSTSGLLDLGLDVATEGSVVFEDSQLMPSPKEGSAKGSPKHVSSMRAPKQQPPQDQEHGGQQWEGPEDLASYFAQGKGRPGGGGGAVGDVGRPPLRAGSKTGTAPQAKRSTSAVGFERVATPQTSAMTRSMRSSPNLHQAAGAMERRAQSSLGLRHPSMKGSGGTPGSIGGAGTPARKRGQPLSRGTGGTSTAPSTAFSPSRSFFRRLREVRGTASPTDADFGDFSLQINGDYDAPFHQQTPEFEDAGWIHKELRRFEVRKKEPHRLTTLPTVVFSPPKIIIMMFRFSNVRNLSVTKSLRKVGYPELHEQFSTTARGGTISKVQFAHVCAKYLTPVDQLDAHKVLDCFDRNALGDVDLNILLIGLQMLLECAAPGDAMRFCFTLMDTANKIPRYITRYEVQTLVAYASAFEEDADESMDAEYLLMAKSIQELLQEAQRYDYMGRMPLRSFLDALDVKMRQKLQAGQKHKKRVKALPATPSAGLAGATTPPSQAVTPSTSHLGDSPQKPQAQTSQDKTRNEFLFGKSFGSNSSAAVAAVHRMSSKKMIVASLSPHEGGY